jgi:hypothetical protein
MTGGLLAFIDALKANGLFSSTLIHFTGDFSRSPRDGASDSGYGSDHGFSACVTSLISGAIDRPLLVGNITASPLPGYASYPGTWGQAAPIADLGVAPGPGNVAATIAELMGIARHPWTSSVPLLKSESGKVQLAVEAPRTVT